MFHSLYLKTLFNLRWQLVGWVGGIALIAFITVIFFDSLAGSSLGQITKSVPPSLQGLVGSLEDFMSIDGYIGQFVFGAKITPILIPMALILFVTQSVSEEDDGRLSTLLTLPIRRSSIYIQKWLAVATVIAIVCVAMAGVTLGAAALLHHPVALRRLAESTLTCLLMCLGIGTIAYGLGMATGRKGVTIALASAYAGGAFIVSSIAPNIDQLKMIDKISLLHYYNTPNIMLHGLNTPHTVLLAATIVITFLFGWFFFTRRSLQLS